MFKIFLFVLVFSSQLLFAQQNNYVEITNIEVDRDNKFIRLSDTLKMKRWSSTDHRRKESFKKALLHRQKEIANDSSKTCSIFFYGKAESIKIIMGGLEIFNQFLSEPSQGYAYFINDFPDNLNTYAIVTLKRNIGIKDAELFLHDSKRVARFKVDTNYSEVYIVAEMVLDLEQLDTFIIDTISQSVTHERKFSITSDTLNNDLPPAPECIEVIREDYDQVRIVHRIPRNRSLN